MKGKNILGIDPGLATIGYGVIKPGNRPRKFLLEEAGIIKTDSNDPKPIRLKNIYSRMEEIIEEFSPQSIAVEQVYFSSNKKTAGLVSEARGVILLASANKKVDSYSPLQVKKTITGYGKANKKQVKMMVKRLLNVNKLPKTDDATDALGIALCQGLCQQSALNRQMRDTNSR